MKKKTLEIYDANSIKIQSVEFQKSSESIGWVAVNFERDKYLPFSLYHSLNKMKETLIIQGYTWEWKNTNWLF